MTGRFRTRFLGSWWLLQLVLWLPFMVLWHGLPVLWKDYPKQARAAWLTLVRGKRGPYPGVVW